MVTDTRLKQFLFCGGVNYTREVSKFDWFALCLLIGIELAFVAMIAITVAYGERALLLR